MISKELSHCQYWRMATGLLCIVSLLTVTGCAAPRLARQSLAKVRPSGLERYPAYQRGNADIRSAGGSRPSPQAGNARSNVPVAPAPELTKTGMQISSAGKGFEYVDATMNEGIDPDAEIRPIDEVFQWLSNQKFKCLATRRVSWRGTKGTSEDRQFGSKRFVIQCEGNCRGIRYRYSGVQALGFHFGLSKPYPVLHFKSAMLGYSNIQWEFVRESNSDPAPQIRIHAWSGDFGDEGPGCRID